MFNLSRPVQVYPKRPAESFLKLLAECAVSMGSYKILDEGGWAERPRRLVLELGVPNHPRYSRVSVVFGTLAEEGPIAVEVMADWSPALNYEIYTSTMCEVVKPLLTAYNRTHSARLRLGLPGPPKPVELPDKAEKILRKYLGQATRGYVHPLDLWLFYEFVIHCHERRVALRPEDLKALLIARGMPDDAAIELEEVYSHGRSLLRRRTTPRCIV